MKYVDALDLFFFFFFPSIATGNQHAGVEVLLVTRAVI